MGKVAGAEPSRFGRSRASSSASPPRTRRSPSGSPRSGPLSASRSWFDAPTGGPAEWWRRSSVSSARPTCSSCSCHRTTWGPAGAGRSGTPHSARDHDGQAVRPRRQGRRDCARGRRSAGRLPLARRDGRADRPAAERDQCAAPGSNVGPVAVPDVGAVGGDPGFRNGDDEAANLSGALRDPRRPRPVGGGLPPLMGKSWLLARLEQELMGVMPHGPSAPGPATRAGGAAHQPDPARRVLAEGRHVVPQGPLLDDDLRKIAAQLSASGLAVVRAGQCRAGDPPVPRLARSA